MEHIGANLENTKRNIEIIGADLVTLHGFTQVPNFILTNKELSVGAKLYYAMLLKYAREKDYCFPGQQTLAEDMGSSERSVRTYQKELEDAGFLEVDTARPRQDEPLQTRFDVQSRREGSGDNVALPPLTGKICRSGPATVAALSGKFAALSI